MDTNREELQIKVVFSSLWQGLLIILLIIIVIIIIIIIIIIITIIIIVYLTLVKIHRSQTVQLGLFAPN